MITSSLGLAASSMVYSWLVTHRNDRSRFLSETGFFLLSKVGGLVTHTFKGKNKSVSFAPEEEGANKTHKHVADLLHMGVV